MVINLQHSGLTSPLFELIKIVEFDIQIIEECFSLKLELFRDVSDSHRFRAHLWRLENYRLQSTFPRGEATGQPAHEPSDENIWVDTGLWLSQDYTDFQAQTPEEATQMVLNDFRSFLVRTLGDKV